MTTQTTTPNCEGCLQPLNPVDALFSAQSPNKVNICMPCVTARMKAATGRGGCRCGSKRRESDLLGRPRQRQWIACLRCLGTVRQVN